MSTIRCAVHSGSVNSPRSHHVNRVGPHHFESNFRCRDYSTVAIVRKRHLSSYDWRSQGVLQNDRRPDWHRHTDQCLLVVTGENFHRGRQRPLELAEPTCKSTSRCVDERDRDGLQRPWTEPRHRAVADRTEPGQYQPGQCLCPFLSVPIREIRGCILLVVAKNRAKLFRFHPVQTVSMSGRHLPSAQARRRYHRVATDRPPPAHEHNLPARWQRSVIVEESDPSGERA